MVLHLWPQTSAGAAMSSQEFCEGLKKYYVLILGFLGHKRYFKGEQKVENQQIRVFTLTSAVCIKKIPDYTDLRDTNEGFKYVDKLSKEKLDVLNTVQHLKTRKIKQLKKFNS